MAIWNSSCNSFADFDQVNVAAGETISIHTTGGPDGSSALKMDVLKVANEVGIRVIRQAQNGRLLEFDFKLDPNVSLDNEHTLVHIWSGASTVVDLLQLRLVPIGSQYRFLFRRVPFTAPLQYTSYNPDTLANPPARGDAGILAYTKRINKGEWHRIKIYQTDDNYAFYFDDKLQVEWLGQINAGTAFNMIAIGKFFSATLSGTMWFDNFTLDVEQALPAVPSTDEAKCRAVWEGYKKRRLTTQGVIRRPHPEGNTQGGSMFNTWEDCVSEGQAYGLMFAVQMNDQTAFDLIETWTFQNLDRRNNAGLSTGRNLMGWHYDTEMSVMIDWNWATDADIDRLKALYWAHEKWGSAGAINYKLRADNIWSDLKLYAFVEDNDAGTIRKIFATDSFQANASNIELNPSYIDPAAFETVRRFNLADTVFIDQAIDGAYRVFENSSDNAGNAPLATTKGLIPDWCGYNKAGSTIQVSTALTGANYTPNPATTPAHDVGMPPNNRATKQSYDAFRTWMRIQWDKKFNNRTRATTLMSGAIKTFYQTEWDSFAVIGAEFEHDGTTIGGRYEKTMMTWMAYFIFLAAGDTTRANAVRSAKLSMAQTYKQAYNGDFFKDNPSSSGPYLGASSYFNDSWCLFAMMTDINIWSDIQGANPLFDSTSGGTAVGALSLTFAHTIASGSNKELIVGAVVDGSQTVSGITYGGVAMTQVDTDTRGTHNVYLFRLLNPVAGTANIIITASAACNIMGASGSFTGADQTTPTDPASAVKGNNITQNSSLAITTAQANTHIIDFIGVFNGSNANVPVAASGQISRQSRRVGTTSTFGAMSTKQLATPGATTMGWDIQTGAGYWIGITIGVKAAPLGPAPSQNSDNFFFGE